MSLPDTQKIQINGNKTLPADWYDAVFLGHIEKENQAVISSHLEFDLKDMDRKIWAVISHDENSLDKIIRLKQALSMADDEVDLTPYHDKHIKIYINRYISDGKFQNEVIDYKAGDDDAVSRQLKNGASMPKRVLIVDDQKEVATLIGNYVQKIGFIPDIVPDVDRALERLAQDNFLMVISDVIMPGKNGFDLVRFVHNKYPKVSVALVSGYFDKEMENLQKVFGIEKIYRKPVFFKAVQEMIASSIQKLTFDGA
jgi:CheY-like chemotaxis protein